MKFFKLIGYGINKFYERKFPNSKDVLARIFKLKEFKSQNMRPIFATVADELISVWVQMTDGNICEKSSIARKLGLLYNEYQNMNKQNQLRTES